DGGGALRVVGGQERDAGRVAAALGERRSADLAEERVGDLDADADAVAVVRLRARGAPVVEVLQDGQGLPHDVVALASVHGGDHADTAGVVLVQRIVQALTLGAAGGGTAAGGCAGTRCEGGSGHQ